MPFNLLTGVYTPASGATTAQPAQVIASATWNTIFADLAAALTGMGTGTFVIPGPGRVTLSANVNFNAVADTPFIINYPPNFTRFRVAGAFISGASQTLTTSSVGLFTGTVATGQTIVAPVAVTVSTASQNANNNLQSLTIANQNTESYNVGTVYLRVTNAQGTVATGNVTLDYMMLP